MRKIAVVLGGMAWAWGGCAAPPAGLLLPHGHPADPASEESPFLLPENPFAGAAKAGNSQWDEPPAPHPGHGGHRP